MGQGDDTYTGPAGGLRAPTPWLGVEDIDGLGDVVVTITDVKRFGSVTFDEGRKQANVGALCLRRRTKMLIINAARRKSLIGLFGKQTLDWRGKSITLYVDPDVKMKGKKVGGIRIRPNAPSLAHMVGRVASAFTSGQENRAKRMIMKRADIEIDDPPTPPQVDALIGAAAELLSDAPPRSTETE